MNNTPELRHDLVIEDQKSRRIVSLHDNNYTIGRDPNSTIILYDRQVSRHHATLVKVNDYQSQTYFYRAIDGNLQGKRSTNGITVNGNPCLTHELRHGDVIRFGSKSQVSYQIITQTTESDIEKSAVDLSLLEEKLDSLVIHQQIPECLSEEYSVKKADVYPEAFDKEEVEIDDLSFSTAILYQGEKPKKTSRDNGVFWRDRFGSTPDLSLIENSPQSIFELTFEGKITYLNPATTLNFPELEMAKVGHPLLEGLISLSPPEDGTSCIREIVIDKNIYEQHIYYFSKKKKSIPMFLTLLNTKNLL